MRTRCEPPPVSNASINSAQRVATVTLCACCRQRPHDAIPDRDLDGYVCRACKRHLMVAEKVAADAGITGCVPDPH